MFSPVRWFFDLNKKCFNVIAKVFPQTKYSAGEYYLQGVRRNLADGFTI